MILLLKKLKAAGTDKNDPAARQKYGAISGGVGILLNLLLFGAKLAAALVSGSVAVIADAFNNLSDAGSSVVTLVGFRLAGKKPDPEHPFGHGRLEYITGFIVSILIILMGYELATSSIEGLRNPQELNMGILTVMVLIGSILVKLYMALYNTLYARFFDSTAMKATAKDSLGDVVASSAVLVSLLISKYTSLQLDAYAGLLVSAFILWSGVSSAKETLQPLLGLPPKKEFVEEIENVVKSQPQIIGMHDLVVHDYGPGRVMISLHAEVPAEVDVFKAHCIVDDLEVQLEEKLGCEAVVHYDPVDMEDGELKRLKAVVSEVVKGVDERLSMHDFRYVRGDTHTNLVFDVVVPYDVPIKESMVKKLICQGVVERLPDHICVIKCDKSRVY